MEKFEIAIPEDGHVILLSQTGRSMSEPSREIQRFDSVYDERWFKEKSPPITEETSVGRKCSLRSRTTGSDIDGVLQVPQGWLPRKLKISCNGENDIANALIAQQRVFLQKETKTAVANVEKSSLHCPVCRCFYVVPVTLSCGHTLCKPCIWLGNGDQNNFNIDCGLCGARNATSRLSTNVLISHLIQRWFPQEYEREVMVLENAQREWLFGKERTKVVALLTDVLKTSPFNFTARRWRSHALFKMEMYQQALEDADQACMLRPFLPSVYHLRGLILVAMDSYEKAAFSFARAVALDPSNDACLSQLLACLAKLLNSESAHRKDFSGQCTALTSSKITSNRHKLTCLSQQWFSGGPVNDDKSGGRNRRNLRKRINSSETASPSTESLWKPYLKRPLQGTELYRNNLSTTEQSLSKIRKLSGHEIQIKTKEDLECKICYAVLFQPITTDCGHTFCRACLQRNLDFRSECPYCRQTVDCRAVTNTAITCEVKEMAENLFQKQYIERELSFADEKAKWKRVGVDEHTEVPVFVCTLAFPSLKYPLHIFEPRYRLMIRKSYELGTGMFGMCAYDPDFGFSEYGTMLSIDKMELLPDGRSIIQTTATRRFRVMSRGMTDGYNTATVQWLEDDAPPELAHGEVTDLDILSTDCRKHLRIWFSSLTEVQQSCVTNAIGPIPSDAEEEPKYSPNGPSWLWWALAAIPLQDRAKLIILSMTSLDERLRSLRRFLELLVLSR